MDPQGGKIPFTEFHWVGPYIIEKCCRITIILYAKLAPTRRKCFIGWECVSSHPANNQLTYKSSHKNINPIPKWAVITTIYMQERGSMTMNSQFLTRRTIIWRRPIRRKFQYSLIFQWRKRGTHQEPHMSVPQKLFLKQTKSVT